MPIHWTDTVTAIASVVVGIGTVGAVLVALFGQSWLERRRAPALSLELGMNSSGMGWIETTGSAEPVTLRVLAAAGKRTALDVEVLLTASWTVNAERDRCGWHVVLDHYPLAWFRALGVAGGPVTRLDIAPGTVREIELLRIGRPMALYDYLGWPPPAPTAGWAQFGPGASEDIVFLSAAAFAVGHIFREPQSDVLLHDHLMFRLRLTLTARDTATVAYETELRVTEEWDPSAPKTVDESEHGTLEVGLKWTKLQRISSSL